MRAYFDLSLDDKKTIYGSFATSRNALPYASSTEYLKLVQAVRETICREYWISDTALSYIESEAYRNDWPPLLSESPAAIARAEVAPVRQAPGSSVTQATSTRSSAVSHAKVLVWKRLGEPLYDVLTITRATNTIADVWDVSGRFAYVGSTARSFDAIVEKQNNGDWHLLGFSWK